MHCKHCLSSTRVFGVCVQCAPKPGALVQDPVLRWFLDTLAEEPDHTLSDDDCRLIRSAATWVPSPDLVPCPPPMEHVNRYRSWHAGKAAAYADSPEATATGEYVGTPPKGRWEGAVYCEKIIGLGPGEYGERFLLIFKHDDATLVWFTGEGGKFDPKEGETYYIRATVKEHKVYNGVRQTIIQRPKIVEEEDDGSANPKP